MWFFYFCDFERNYDVLKSKSSCFLLNENINFHKNEREQKLKIRHKVLERQSLCFSSYKNYKLKVKLWWLELVKEKRGHFLYRLFCPKKIFSTLILMYMYWVHFQNINTFTYQKTLLHTLLLLLFKIVESLQCILHEKSLFHSKIFF